MVQKVLGKTTLSRKLATHYKTAFVPEFARDYLQKKYDQSGEVCSFEDLVPIAIGQRDLENSAVPTATYLLFCDTDPLETLTYSEIYFNTAPQELVETVKNSRYDLYLLLDVIFPGFPMICATVPTTANLSLKNLKQTFLTITRTLK